MPRSENGGPSDSRARIIALAEALDRLIATLRMHLQERADWLQALVGLVGDVRDLIEADARLGPDDLRDVCTETSLLFARLERDPGFAHTYRRLIARQPDVRKASAECARALREICASDNHFET